ncbi:hypothetical protein [Brevibacterium otitidis]|uniref:Uncharacterized protein n=2 Tax=Brevibacterium otitidis TaxID=53364 RepID=A0ABV5X2I9_9MICO
MTERGWLTRVYEPIDGKRVHICVSWPRRARPEPDSEWLSIIRSHGLSEDIDKEIYGVDEVQAMELAIFLLVSLESSNGLSLPD